MGQISMTTFAGAHGDLFGWGRGVEGENTRIAEVNARRVGDRGQLGFVTDSSEGVDPARLQRKYACLD
jgi:hypothetical protein